jgi:hypothetical protein
MCLGARVFYLCEEGNSGNRFGAKRDIIFGIGHSPANSCGWVDGGAVQGFEAGGAVGQRTRTEIIKPSMRLLWWDRVIPGSGLFALLTGWGVVMGAIVYIGDGSPLASSFWLLVGLILGFFSYGLSVLLDLCSPSLTEQGASLLKKVRGKDRFSDRSKKVLGLGLQEAIRFNHTLFRTAHLFLGLVKEEAGTASQILIWHDIDLRRTRFELERIVGVGPDLVTMGTIPKTPEVETILIGATEEANKLHQERVEPEHLLLAFLREQPKLAVQILRNLGTDPQTLFQEVLRVLAANPSADN